MSNEDIKGEMEKLKDKQNRVIFDSYFKYFGDSNEIITSVFKDNKIRFTQPRELNDPLEFNPTMRFTDVKGSGLWKITVRTRIYGWKTTLHRQCWEKTISWMQPLNFF